MQCRQCDVIGCPEAAAWVRAVPEAVCLEDFLCNACRLKLAAHQPERAAYYTRFNVELVTPQERPSGRSAKPVRGGDVIVIQ